MRYIIISLLILFSFSNAFADKLPTIIGGVLFLPDNCHIVDRMEDGQIFLKRTESCVSDGQPKETYISFPTADWLASEVEIILPSGALWQKTTPKDVAEGFRDIAKTIHPDAVDYSLVEGIKLTKEEVEEANPEAYKIGMDLGKINSSAKSLEELRENVMSLYHEHFRETAERLGFGLTAVNDITKGHRTQSFFNKGDRLFIFITSGMPLDTLRNYSKVIHELGGNQIVMVLRGFVGKDLTAMADWLMTINKEDLNCKLYLGEDCKVRRVQIMTDPLMYYRFDVVHAPTFIFVKNSTWADQDQSFGVPRYATFTDYYRLAGEMSLEAVLRIMYRETKDESLGNAIKHLEEKGYYKNEDKSVGLRSDVNGNR